LSNVLLFSIGALVTVLVAGGLLWRALLDGRNDTRPETVKPIGLGEHDDHRLVDAA
jgi:hypothetical protein